MASNKLHCGYCKASYKSKFCMFLHQRLHEGKSTTSTGFQCNLCKKRFTRFGCYQWHCDYHEKSKLLKSRTSTKANTKETLHICEYCHRMFKGFHSIEKHRTLFCRKRPKDKSWRSEQLSGNNIFRSIIPTFIPQYPAQEKSFLVTHSGFSPMGQSFFCRLCGKHCPQQPKSLYQSHMQSQQLPPICDGCMETFHFQSNLHGHFQIQQPLTFSQARNILIENPLVATNPSIFTAFSCFQCGTEFTNKDAPFLHICRHTGQLPFICTKSKCGKSFVEKTLLTKHIQNTHKGFSCSHCGKKFLFKSQLVQHSRIHTTESPYVCNECGKKFSFKQSLTRHLHAHSREKPFACDECGLKFSSRSKLWKHFCTKTGQRPRPFVCDECGKTFAFKRHLITHSYIHTGERPFVCNECGKAFKARDHLLVHQHTHTGQKPFVCNECGKKFSRKHSLKKHSHSHTGKYPYVCDECGRGFSVKDGLVKHSRIHTGERPFVCEQCGKGFCVKSNLVYHKHKHAGTQPHVCKECGKGFIQKEGLVKHLRVHTGEQPFACNECGKRFTVKSNLVVHIQRHKQEQKEQPFGCDVCGKRFTMKKNLRRHRLTKLGCNPAAALTKPD